MINVMKQILAASEKCRNIAIASGAHEAYRAVGLAFNELDALLRQAIAQAEKVESVGYLTLDGDFIVNQRWQMQFGPAPQGKPLYTHPPTAPAQPAVPQDIRDHLFIESRQDGVWLVCLGGVHDSQESARKACEEWKQSAPRNSDVSEMVNRFLCWKLPKDFAPDCGISFKCESDYDHPEYGRTKFEPTGTNLFTAQQAKAMFEHVLTALEAPAQPEQPINFELAYWEVYSKQRVELTKVTAPAQQIELDDIKAADCCPYCEALIHPPAQQPLTEAEVEQIRNQWNDNAHRDQTRYVVRMTEQAHGITGGSL